MGRRKNERRAGLEDLRKEREVRERLREVKGATQLLGGAEELEKDEDEMKEEP